MSADIERRDVAPHVRAVMEALLRHGGNPAHGFGGFQRWVDITPPEARRLLQEGVVISFDAQRVHLHPMRARECHSNSEDLARGNPTYHLMTGLGMGNPATSPPHDVWRVHSWVVTNEGTVIETTAPRKLYAGFLVHPRKPDARELANILNSAYTPVRARSPRD